jgi:hypothetical protein
MEGLFLQITMTIERNNDTLMLGIDIYFNYFLTMDLVSYVSSEYLGKPIDVGNDITVTKDLKNKNNGSIISAMLQACSTMMWCKMLKSQGLYNPVTICQLDEFLHQIYTGLLSTFRKSRNRANYKAHLSPLQPSILLPFRSRARAKLQNEEKEDEQE